MLGNNMFAYCRSNPVCRVDISGTEDAVAYNDGEITSDDNLTQLATSGGFYFDAEQAILDGKFAGGYSYGGSNYNLLPNWISTGRSQPSNLYEQIAIKAARTNPHSGKVIIETLHDPRLTGFSKYSRYYPTAYGGIEVHYVGNPESNTFGDFKIK